MQALQKQNYTTIAQMLEKSRDSIAAALPKHLTVERLSRVALGELRTNAKLLDCAPASLMNAIVKASQLGLEVGSAMGHAYLVPYKTECTLIIGYRGMLALARRSGEIQSITARVVYAKDLFELEYGLDEKLRHIPSTDEDPGPVTHVYAVARLVDGGIQYEVMTRAEVEAIRKRSRAGNAGPWISDWSEMSRKTVLRRLFKYLPMSIEMADAVATDADEDTPAERTDTRATVTDLNARLSAETKAIPAPSESDWPRPNADGELVDVRGLAWIEAAHSANKTTNADGTWRIKRGADVERVKVLEAEAMANRQDAALAEGNEPASNTNEFERIKTGIETAADQQAIDEWFDYSREVVISKTQREELERVAIQRKGQWSE